MMIGFWFPRSAWERGLLLVVGPSKAQIVSGALLAMVHGQSSSVTAEP